QRGSSLWYPGNSESRPQIICTGYRTGSPRFGAVVEHEVVGPLKIFTVLDLYFPQGIRLQRISEQGSLAHVHANLGFMPSRRNEVVRRADASRLHRRFVVLAAHREF